VDDHELWEGQRLQIEVEEVAKVILFVFGVRSIEGLHREGGSGLFRPLSRGAAIVGDVADLAVFHQFNAGFDNRMATYKVLELASLLVKAS
jgi:hypothetical protein